MNLSEQPLDSFLREPREQVSREQYDQRAKQRGHVLVELFHAVPQPLGEAYGLLVGERGGEVRVGELGEDVGHVSMKIAGFGDW